MAAGIVECATAGGPRQIGDVRLCQSPRSHATRVRVVLQTVPEAVLMLRTPPPGNLFALLARF
jgi:hypothetical protein